jgi:hypothetical protein
MLRGFTYETDFISLTGGTLPLGSEHKVSDCWFLGISWMFAGMIGNFLSG